MSEKVLKLPVKTLPNGKNSLYKYCTSALHSVVCLTCAHTDTSVSLLVWLSYRDKESCVSLSATNGAVVLLAVNAIAEEFSKGTS